MGEPSEPIQPSGYMTLIPLNGARSCIPTLLACVRAQPLVCLHSKQDSSREVLACSFNSKGVGACRCKAEAATEAPLLHLHGARTPEVGSATGSHGSRRRMSTSPLELQLVSIFCNAQYYVA